MVAALKLMVKRNSNGRQISNGVGRRSLVRYVEAIVCCVCRVTILIFRYCLVFPILYMRRVRI